MVGPMPDGQRESLRRRLMASVVLLVGASGALIALQADAALWQVGLAALAGLLVGGALTWYLFSGMVTRSSRRRQREHNRR